MRGGLGRSFSSCTCKATQRKNVFKSAHPQEIHAGRDFSGWTGNAHTLMHANSTHIRETAAPCPFTLHNHGNGFRFSRSHTPTTISAAMSTMIVHSSMVLSGQARPGQVRSTSVQPIHTQRYASTGNRTIKWRKDNARATESKLGGGVRGGVKNRHRQSALSHQHLRAVKSSKVGLYKRRRKKK